MPLPLIRRHTVWLPTMIGWTIILLLFSAAVAVWWFHGEDFLCRTDRQSADVLVVEGWIGIEGITAAKAEFDRGGYRHVVTAGGQFVNSWGPQRWNYATEAKKILMRAGMADEAVIAAPSRDAESRRTFESAAAVQRALATRAMQPAAVNVFTFGPHARRSRLVFAKVLDAPTKVGVIAWLPPDPFTGPWWRSSERAQNLIKETVGYLFEVLLNSGRMSNSAELKIDPAK